MSVVGGILQWPPAQQHSYNNRALSLGISIQEEILSTSCALQTILWDTQRSWFLKSHKTKNKPGGGQRGQEERPAAPAAAAAAEGCRFGRIKGD